MVTEFVDLLEQFSESYFVILTCFCSFISQFIGSKETDQKADAVSKLGILDFWTPDNHYRWSVSRYGGHVSASVESVSPSRLFLCSMFFDVFLIVYLLDLCNCFNAVSAVRFGCWGN